MEIERCAFATAVMIDGTTHLSANPKNCKKISYDTDTMIYEIIGLAKGSKTIVHSTNVQYAIPAEQTTSVSSSKRTPKEA